MTGIDPAALTSDEAVRAAAERLADLAQADDEQIATVLEDEDWLTHQARAALEAAVASALAGQGTGGDDTGTAEVFLVWGTNYVPDEDHTLLSVHATEEGARAVLDGVRERHGRFVAALLPEWKDVPFDQIAGPDRREVLPAPASTDTQEGRTR